MRKIKMVLAVLFGVACFVVAFMIPNVQGAFFIGAVLGFAGTVVPWYVIDWQLFKMKLERERGHRG